MSFGPIVNLENAIPLLQAGGVGVLPTDTTYGIVACAADKEAVSKLYALKNREQKPGPIIAASIDQFVALGIPRRYIKPVEHYWPNPISIIIPCDAQLTYLHQGLFSLALRIPADAKLRQLLEQTGPLLTSSANHPGEEPASTVAAAQQYFGDTVAFYVDGGDFSGRPPSTVIRVIDDAVDVVREGAIKINEYGEISS